MAPPLSSDAIERMAHKRAAAKLGFYLHVVVYVLVNLFMFMMSQYGLRSRPWTMAPLLGWGLGLALHGVSVFMLGKGSSMRERMVQKERERIEREQGRT